MLTTARGNTSPDAKRWVDAEGHETAHETANDADKPDKSQVTSVAASGPGATALRASHSRTSSNTSAIVLLVKTEQKRISQNSQKRGLFQSFRPRSFGTQKLDKELHELKNRRNKAQRVVFALETKIGNHKVDFESSEKKLQLIENTSNNKKKIETAKKKILGQEDNLKKSQNLLEEKQNLLAVVEKALEENLKEKEENLKEEAKNKAYVLQLIGVAASVGGGERALTSTNPEFADMNDFVGFE